MSEHNEKRTYTREFKLEALWLHEASNRSIHEIKQELGITPYLLARCVRQFRQGETEAFPGKARPHGCAGNGQVFSDVSKDEANNRESKSVQYIKDHS